MNTIGKPNVEDSKLLSDIATKTFVESHGSSASIADINSYVTEKYSVDAFKDELCDQKNIYHIIYVDKIPAGYSKIIFDSPYPGSPEKNITKLERLYIQKEFYGSKSGLGLFNFNIELSKSNGQRGMWLYTWKENLRAINFYKKNGFIIIGSHDFKITETHSNPNYQMFLEY